MRAVYRADITGGSPYHDPVSTYLAKLDERGALLLAGPDGRKFLQGQATCDVEALSNGDSTPGAVCNPQGRMLSDFRLWQLAEDRLVLCLHQSVVPATLEGLSRYIIFSKATLEDASDTYQQFALWGEEAAQLVQAPDDESVSGWQCHSAWVCRSSVPGAYDILLETSAVSDFEAAMVDAHRADQSAWSLAEIKAGLGHVRTETRDLFLPQMLNFQHTGHISFTKGCYTGQEVVARMHYRGKVKRPMQLASLPADAITNAPSPGDPLFKDDTEQAIGHIVSVAKEDDVYWLLVSATRDAPELSARLEAGQTPLQFMELPYALSE